MMNINLSLSERESLRTQFLDEYFKSKSSAAHTAGTFGRVLEEYEEHLSQNSGSGAGVGSKFVKHSYFLTTLQLNDHIEVHTFKIPEGMLPHQILISSPNFMSGIILLSCMRITEDEYDSSGELRILPPEFLQLHNTSSKDE